MRRRAALVALAVVALAALGAGCGKTDEAETLDRPATERAVDKVIGGRIEPDVDEVVCPAEMPRGKGRRATCRAVLADGAGEVRLRVRQVDDDGRLDVALLQAVVDRKDVADDLRRQLVKVYLRSFVVDCGKAGIEVVDPGTTFTCDAKDANSKRTIDVTVASAAGTLRYDITKP